MSDVEDRLAEIEGRARENWPTSEDVATLAAALRAVLALIEETRLPAPDCSILGGRVSATRLYAAIARELTP